jgi:hypothetical protein
VDEFVTLVSPIDGTPWECPAGAVDAWVVRGWLPWSPPPIAADPPEPEPAKPARTAKTKNEE